MNHKPPFLQKPVVNFMAGVLITGALFGLWNLAEGLGD